MLGVSVVGLSSALVQWLVYLPVTQMTRQFPHAEFVVWTWLRECFATMVVLARTPNYVHDSATEAPRPYVAGG